MTVTPRSPARGTSRARRTAPRREFHASPSFSIPPRALAAIPLVLIVLAIVGYQVAFAGRIYPGVSALGMRLNGNTPDEAEKRLARRTSDMSNTAVVLGLGDRTWRTTAADVGMKLDPRALADAAFAIGRDGGILTRLASQGGALLAGTEVAWDAANPNEAALAAFVNSIAKDVDQPVQDAYLAVQPDLSLDYRQGSIGRTLDREAVQKKVRESLLEGGQIDLTPFVKETQPKTSDAQITDARAKAERILASPLTLKFEDREWTIEREALAGMLTFENKSGQVWTAKVNDTPLRDRLSDIAGEIDQESQDARLYWEGGTVGVLRESREGRKLDQAAALVAARAALESEDHTVELPVVVAKPAIDTRDIPNMGIVELIDHASTSFAGGIPEKQHNIKLAASRLNGVVVPPGATFSFNKEVGPTTVEAGFEWGYGLESNGDTVKTVPSVAGGICQVATTLFQPVFWSGFQLEERNWHLYWIPAYTSRNVVGLDATVDEAAGLDFKFVNNADTYLLIQSWTEDDGTVHFALYGTKPSWQVHVDPPILSNTRKSDPKPAYEERPDQTWGWKLQVSAARDGFDVAIVRTVSRGDEIRTLKLTSTYQPSQNVTMVGTKDKPDGVDIASLFPTPGPEPTPDPNATPATDATPDPNATPNPAAPPATDASPAAGQSGDQAAQPTATGEAAPAQPAAQPADPTAAPAAQPAGQPADDQTASGQKAEKRRAKPTPTPEG